MSEDNVYKDGDIVWVKLGNNWWPGEVIDAHRHPDDTVTNIKRKLYCIVKFFNENAYEYVSNVKQIYPFQCSKKAEFLKKGLSLYKSGNKFMEKFPEDVEVAERLTRHQQTSVYINDRPDSIVKAILGQPLVLNSEDEYYGNSDYREKRQSSESITKIINLNPTKNTNATDAPPQQIRVEASISAYNNTNKTDILLTRSSLGGEGMSSSRLNIISKNSPINNNTYNCNICDFTSVRQNVMILHRKMHSSRNGTSFVGAMTNKNSNQNRSNTKVNILAPATIKVNTTASAVTPATNITCVSSTPIESALIFSNKTNDQNTNNSSPNDSFISFTTDSTAASDLDLSNSDARDLHIRRSMRRTTRTTDDVLKGTGTAYFDDLNGLTECIDLQENKPIKKIPKKRNFINLNLTRSEEITPSIVLDLQPATTHEAAALESSRPATPVAKAEAEKIRRMLLEDWTDEDETLDNDNKVSSENKKMDRNTDIIVLSPVPLVTSTPCTDPKSLDTSTRIRNIPKKDRRNVILHDFSQDLELLEAKQKDREQCTQPVVLSVEESSNSSAVEVIEVQQSAIITINDEDEEVKEGLNTPSMSVNFKEPNDKYIPSSVLSCFDFQASDDEDENDNSAAPSVTGCGLTPATAHFKKKYLSSEKSQTLHTQEINTQQHQQIDDDISEKDQQLTAEIEKLLAITQPAPTDLLTSGNSIEECLSVKDLPIKERGKRIFKSRNRSRIEEKSMHSISTDDSFSKDIESSNKLENKRDTNAKKEITMEIQPYQGKVEAEIDKSPDNVKEDSEDLQSNDNFIEMETQKMTTQDNFEIIINSSGDSTSEEREDAVGAANTINEMTTTETTTSPCKNSPVKLKDRSVEIIIEKPTTNAIVITTEHEKLTDVHENCTENTMISSETEVSEDTIKSSPLNDNPVTEELAKEQESLSSSAVPNQQTNFSEEDINDNCIQLIKESTNIAPSLEIKAFADHNHIPKKDNDLEVGNIALDAAYHAKEDHTESLAKKEHAECKNQLNENDIAKTSIIASTDKNIYDKNNIVPPQDTNQSNLSTTTPKTREVKTQHLNENIILKPNQTDTSTAEEFALNRLLTTTPPTDENSSMGASDTGAEFGSPTSMLSEERLPTFRFGRNDTPQRDIECATNINDAKTTITTLNDNASGPQTLTYNVPINKAVSTLNSHQKYDINNPKNDSIPNNNSTIIYDNTEDKHLESSEQEGLPSKHDKQILSTNLCQAKQKSSVEHQQRGHRYTKHSTRTKENQMYMPLVEKKELICETTAEISSERKSPNSTKYTEINEAENSGLVRNLIGSVDLLKQNVDNAHLKKSETELSKAKVVKESQSQKDPLENITTIQVDYGLRKDLEDQEKEPKRTVLEEIESANKLQVAENALENIQELKDNVMDTLINLQEGNALTTNPTAEINEMYSEIIAFDENQNDNEIQNKTDNVKTVLSAANADKNTPRTPKKRIGETISPKEPKYKKCDFWVEQTEQIKNNETDSVKAFIKDIESTESATKSNSSEKNDVKESYTNCSLTTTRPPQISNKVKVDASSCLDVEQSEIKTQSLSKPKQQNLIIDCETIVPLPLELDDKQLSSLGGKEIENIMVAAEEVVAVSNPTLPLKNNVIENQPSVLTIADVQNNELDGLVEVCGSSNSSQVVVMNDTQESYEPARSSDEFLIVFDGLVNPTSTSNVEEYSNSTDLHNLNEQIPKELSPAVSNVTKAAESSVYSPNNHNLLFDQKVAIKRRKTICFELAEFGLQIGESSRKRQVIDFEDALPEESMHYKRRNERKMTLPDSFDFNSQFKSFKPRRSSSIEENLKRFSKNLADVDEELGEEGSTKLTSGLAAKQIGIDAKGNKYIVIKDTSSASVSSYSQKQLSDSSDSSFCANRNSRTMKRKSSESKATTSKASTKPSLAILSRRYSLPAENASRVFNSFSGCVAIKPKITRDQVISSLNDNQLSTAQQQLMQLQQQQQQQQRVQSLSIAFNKQPSSRLRKTHRTPNQHQNQQVVQQVQLQQQQQQLITQPSNQQLQLVAPQVQQQIPAANEGFIIATAASAEDDNVIDSNTQLIALPTQPYPGYTETFLLCKVNGNTCKPVDNVPLYLDHQLNELVPIPLDVLESTPKIVTNEDGTIEAKHCHTQQLILQDKSTEQITFEEVVAGETEISSQENVLSEQQYLPDTVLTAPVSQEEVSADLSSNNGILLNIEGQQVLLDAVTFEHLLANPDANTQLISDDGTEYVLTHEVLQALYIQQQQEQQQQQQILDVTNTSCSNNDIIAVAMAGSDLYGNGVLTIDTSQSVQLLEGNGGMVFQQPLSTAMVQQHLTPPAVVTNAVLDQSPIMSTLEVPSGSRIQVPHCITVPSLPIVAPSSVILGSGGTHPNLDDSLAAIGVTAQSSTSSSALGLPITVTDPNIASKVTSAGPLNEILQLVSHRPATAAATAAAVAAAALAGETRIFHD